MQVQGGVHVFVFSLTGAALAASLRSVRKQLSARVWQMGLGAASPQGMHPADGERLIDSKHHSATRALKTGDV